MTGTDAVAVVKVNAVNSFKLPNTKAFIIESRLPFIAIAHFYNSRTFCVDSHSKKVKNIFYIVT